MVFCVQSFRTEQVCNINFRLGLIYNVDMCLWWHIKILVRLPRDAPTNSSKHSPTAICWYRSATIDCDSQHTQHTKHRCAYFDGSELCKYLHERFAGTVCRSHALDAHGESGVNECPGVATVRCGLCEVIRSTVVTAALMARGQKSRIARLSYPRRHSWPWRWSRRRRYIRRHALLGVEIRMTYYM